jgi:hypothetical protein
MKQYVRSLLALLSLCLVVTACQGSDPRRARERPAGGAPTPSSSAFERCEGNFACTVYSEGYEPSTGKGDLVRRGEDCLWRNADGTPAIDLADPEVTLYDDYFTVVPSFDGGIVILIECLPLDETASNAAGASCRGSSTSCTAIPFLDCTAQRGCFSSIGDAYTVGDERCRGSADDCDSFERRADCEHQRGCRWTG